MALMLVGCSVKVPYNYQPEKKVTDSAVVNETKTVLVGGSILHYQVEEISDALEVKANIQDSLLFGGTILIPAGAYRKIGSNNSSEFFEPQNYKGDRVIAHTFIPTALVYRKESGNLEIAIAGDTLLWSHNGGFKVLRNQRFKQRGEDFQLRSISYAGSHGNLVNFDYREGSNNQRITHSMSSGKIFRYGGAEIEIIKYDAHSMTCKVLKGLDVFL